MSGFASVVLGRLTWHSTKMKYEKFAERAHVRALRKQGRVGKASSADFYQFCQARLGTIVASGASADYLYTLSDIEAMLFHLRCEWRQRPT